MAAVMGLPGAQVAEVCAAVARDHGVVVLANHNSDAQVAISGEVAAVEAAGEALREAGAKRVVPLNVSGAFHSPLLEGAGREFAGFLADIAVADATVPLVANVTALPVSSGADLKEGFARQLTSPVLWHDTMVRLAAEQKPAVILEVGPGKVLTGLARRAYPETRFLPVGTLADLDGVADAVAGG
jgi:[acyl-carrier-protein] S-malonyltransferase